MNQPTCASGTRSILDLFPFRIPRHPSVCACERSNPSLCLSVYIAKALSSTGFMDIEALQIQLSHALQQASSAFQKVPGSAVLVRYIRSSYQNDPVRSAIELVLILFFIRYLLSPSYSTHKQNFVKLREDVSPLPFYIFSL